jgi:hypothetical protein
VQEVKSTLEQLKIRAEQRQEDTLVETREGMPAGEKIQIIVQGSTKFMITSDMLYIDEEAI